MKWVSTFLLALVLVGALPVLSACDDDDGDDSTATATESPTVDPDVDTPTPTTESISWDEVEGLLATGDVEYGFQAHSREVRLTLKDGTIYVTTEPGLDDIFDLVRECGDPCAEVILVTE